MYITTTKTGLYLEFPQGRPAQKLFFNLKDDPKEQTNTFTDSPAVKQATENLRSWLQQTQPPHVKHSDDHSELLRMSGE